MTVNRRELGRRLNTLTDASVAEVLATRGDEPLAPPNGSDGVRRIGFTGPPGVGKSSLIGALAQRRVAQGANLAVLCIDPTSPVSGGSILGDRIRIDGDLDIYVRSVPSRQSNDGLTDNLPDLLAALDGGGFDEIWVETVGVGQAAYGVRRCVDTVVVLVLPGSGDTVQAMKAGILEVGDVHVVTKGDRPGADQLAAELATIVDEVIVTSTVDGRGLDELLAALDAGPRPPENGSTTGAQPAADDRIRYDVERLITRRVRELLADTDATDLTLRQAYHHIIGALEGDI